MDLGELPGYRMAIGDHFAGRIEEGGDAGIRRFHAGAAPYVSRVVAALSLPDEGRFLDIGCGSGLVSLAVAKVRPSMTVHGIDFSDRSLAVGRRLAEAEGLRNVRFEEGDAEAPPAGPWDRAAVLSVFNLLPDKRAALTAWRQGIAPRGRLVVTDALSLGASSSGVGPLSEPALLHLLQQTGWQVVHREDITPLIARLGRDGAWLWTEYLRPGFRYVLLALEPAPAVRGPGSGRGSTS